MIVVEWGTPKSATIRGVCTISAQHTVRTASEANHLATQLAHQHHEGTEKLPGDFFTVSYKKSRVVYWNKTGTFFIAVSFVGAKDGTSGAYAALADAEALKILAEAQMAEEDESASSKHECGLDRTYCDKCCTELEVGQVGYCESCA